MTSLLSLFHSLTLCSGRVRFGAVGTHVCCCWNAKALTGVTLVRVRCKSKTWFKVSCCSIQQCLIQSMGTTIGVHRHPIWTWPTNYCWGTSCVAVECESGVCCACDFASGSNYMLSTKHNALNITINAPLFTKVSMAIESNMQGLLNSTLIWNDASIHSFIRCGERQTSFQLESNVRWKVSPSTDNSKWIGTVLCDLCSIWCKPSSNTTALGTRTTVDGTNLTISIC